MLALYFPVLSRLPNQRVSLVGAMTIILTATRNSFPLQSASMSFFYGILGVAGRKSDRNDSDDLIQFFLEGILELLDV
jgi:hypothetical protein